MLKLTKIKKDYKVAQGVVPALKGVSLEFRESEFVCILGQSGCGKTTLLNIIGGLDHYSSGDLVIQGKSTKNFSDRDWDVYRNHQIGFIFQSYNLIPHQTVLGNVELALTIAGVSREERHERAKQALERVGLGKELFKRPNQLSGGQMQRVAIARALVNNPSILLADEPTGALDSETSVQIMELIKEIAQERLVIMVTHNPELAELYASRIVRLKDGEVESDNNPYHSIEEEVQMEHAGSANAEEPQTAENHKKKGKKQRAKMSFLSSLVLSARNLLTKKGRTIVTSIAGSIGIISVCLVLALSNGFNNYIKRTEEDMLSYYPISITESSMDMAAIMTSFTSPQDMPDMSKLDDKVYVDSFLTSLGGKMTVTNNITDNYLKYISEMNENWYGAIQYGYGTTVVNNLFTHVQTKTSKIEDGSDGSEIVLDETVRSLSNLKQYYIGVVQQEAPDYSSLVGYADFFGNVVSRMPGTSDFTDSRYGMYVQSQYDVIAGAFPQNANEAVIVVGKNNEISDLTLAQLGLLDEKKFVQLFRNGENGGIDPDGELPPESVVGFSQILSQKYTLFYNDVVYSRDTANYPLDDPKLSLTGKYPFVYSGGQREKGDLTAKDGEGINIKVTGILRLKDELTYGCLTSGLNLTEATINEYIQGNMQSQIVQWMKDSAKSSIDLGDLKDMDPTFADYEGVRLFFPAAANLTEKGFTQRTFGQNTVYVAISPEEAIRALGGDDTVNSVHIYAKDFDSKEALLNYLDDWNAWCTSGSGSYNGIALTDADKITYSDTVGLLMGMMQTMLDVITIVLVAFTAISLVVSSVMIGIITYVSVVERVKEIGVLRSLGARKQDIRNLFNAETFIIGLAAGLIGIIVTYLLSIGINAIIVSLAGIAGIAALPPLTAFIMVCVSVCLTLVSGLIPAQAAAKKDPVIALRTE